MSTELSVHEKIDRFRNATWRKKRRVDLATLNPWVPVHVAEEFSTNVHYASLQQSTCVPPRGVLISIANRHVKTVRQTALSRVADLKCLMNRFVSLCLGGYRDHRDKFGVCVEGPKDTGAMRFGTDAWHSLTWAKWPLLHLALLAGARPVVFVDADVLLLSNPFDHIGSASTLAAHALLHQEDHRGCEEVCDVPCRINTGVLVVTSAALCERVMQELHPRAMHPRLPLEQDVVQWGLKYFLRADGFSTCRLPPSFAGYCGEPAERRRWRARGYRLPDRCGLVTYHATCVNGTSEKLSRLRAVLSEAKGCVRQAWPPRGASGSPG